jgi:hypothetical protein
MNLRSIVLALVLLVGAVPAFAGPPWVSIEIPSNPFDRATRGAFFLVRTYHHGTPIALQVRGTMEGIVDGERVSRSLTLERTGTLGLWAVKTSPPSDGAWVLVVYAGADEYSATALVDVTEGVVRRIDVPYQRGGEVPVPRAVAPSEIDARLEALAMGDTPVLLAKPGHGDGHGLGFDPVMIILLGAVVGLIPIGAFAVRRARRR